MNLINLSIDFCHFVALLLQDCEPHVDTYKLRLLVPSHSLYSGEQDGNDILSLLEILFHWVVPLLSPL